MHQTMKPTRNSLTFHSGLDKPQKCKERREEKEDLQYPCENGNNFTVLEF